MQTQDEMNVLVPEKLVETERDYDVTVLWAIESGSRAWGFESPDSDFDVRFIYRHKQDFLSPLSEQRDVIELPIDDTWDVSGWDLDKTLKLLYKSNPILFEWLQSPLSINKRILLNAVSLLTSIFQRKNAVSLLDTARTQMNKYLFETRLNLKSISMRCGPFDLPLDWKKYHSVPSDFV